MIGWLIFFLVLISFFFFLTRRGRKRLQASLAELASRVAQVEELLLEICAVLEEKEPFPELPEETEEPLSEDESDVIAPQSIVHPEVDPNPAAREERPPRQESPGANEQGEIRELLIGEGRLSHQKRPERETNERTGGNLSEQPKQKPGVQSKPKLAAHPREAVQAKRPEQTAARERDVVSQNEKGNTAQPQVESASRGRESNKERLAKIDPAALPERSRKIIELLQKGLSVKEIARSTGMGQGEVQLIIDLYLQ
jgi:hypothetical protein